VPGTRWHTSPQCITIKSENKVIEAPDSMLRAYGITCECEQCKLRDAREASRDTENDLRAYQNLLSVVSTVIGVQCTRLWLRNELLDRKIKFNLRESKERLARKLCRCCLREKDLSLILPILSTARAHWQNRIDEKDRHRPTYYVRMLAKTDQSLLLASTAQNDFQK